MPDLKLIIGAMRDMRPMGRDRRLFTTTTTTTTTTTDCHLYSRDGSRTNDKDKAKKKKATKQEAENQASITARLTAGKHAYKTRSEIKGQKKR